MVRLLQPDKNLKSKWFSTEDLCQGHSNLRTAYHYNVRGFPREWECMR